MPYITEEIWQSIKPLLEINADTIMMQSYPEADPALIDESAQTGMDWAQQFIVGIRKIRSEMDIKPGKALPVLLNNWSANDQQQFEQYKREIMSLAKVESADWLTDGSDAPDSATALVGEMQILIPLAGLIDKDAETARLTREIEKINKQLMGVMGRLNNPAFTDKAPANVVAQVQKQADEQQAALDQLQQQLVKIESM
jgi:valyl-tRNA synthetase